MRIWSEEIDQSLRIAIRQGAHEHSIHQAEDRGTRSDSQRERKDDYKAEGTMFEERSPAVADVS